MDKLKKLLSVVLLFSILALTLIGCSGEAVLNNNKGDKDEIVFSEAGWDSMQLHNAIAGLIAEELYGYSWTELPGSGPILHEGLLDGDVDVYMEHWTDTTADYEEDLAAGKFQELSINFDDNQQGLYVPRYVIEGDEERGIEASAPDLEYVEDLKRYPQVFQDEEEEEGVGRLYGSIPGWEIDNILQNKHQYYGLDENFVYFNPGSQTAMDTAIISAYEKGEPIVSYYWEPTWLLGEYDMVLLKDEPYDTEERFENGETEFKSAKVTISASNEFVENEDNKEMVEFLENYETSSQLTSEGLAYIQETDASYEEAAEWFLKENQDLLDKWLDPEDAEAMKKYLED